MTRSKTLLLAGLLLGVLLLVPIANADHLDPHWSRVNPATASGYNTSGCNPSSSTVTLPAGEYVVTSGMGGGASSATTDYFALRNPSNQNVLVVRRDGTMPGTPYTGTTAYSIISHHNLTSHGTGSFYAAIRFTLGSSQTVRIDCGSADGGLWKAWNLPSGVSTASDMENWRATYVEDTWTSGFFFNYVESSGSSAFAPTLTAISDSEILARWPAQALASYYKLHMNETSGFTPSANDYELNTTNINAAVSNLTSARTYCFKILAYNSTHANYLTSSEACATTHRVSLSFWGNRTRVVSDNVTVYISRNDSADYLVDCVRTDPSGAVASACTADAWPSSDADNNYTFRFPQSITNTTSTMVGTYVLYVTNLTGAYIGGTAFCVQSAWSANCNYTVGADLQVQLGRDTTAEYGAVQDELNNANLDVTETSVRGWFLGALAYALEPTSIFELPPIVIWYCVLMACGIVGVVGRSKGVF